VTGLPRSGTTWLARLLAAGPGTAMPGREPMNPRERQFALGGTLRGWTRLDPDARQQRLLRRCDAGREVRTLSRYGVRQWAAALPGTRVVVKDPFAMLSLSAIVRTTGATPVLLYRHPGAVLVSYRRMGWRADSAEIARLGAPRPPADDDVTAMGIFWSWCNDVALDDLAALGRGLLVGHEDLVVGGDSTVAGLRARLGLAAPRQSSREATAPAGPRGQGLHDFDRDPVELTQAWRRELTDEETATLETLTAATADRLAAARVGGSR
jgi:Sulfotransferase family